MIPTRLSPDPDLESAAELEKTFREEAARRAARERVWTNLRLLWHERRFLARVTMVGALATLLVALLIPKQYISTAKLMPSENNSGANLGMIASLLGQAGAPGGLSGIAGNLVAMKSSGALFVGILGSRTVEDRIVARFDLKKVYGQSLVDRARQALEANTSLTEDRKSGIIQIDVTDHDAKRAAGIAGAYIEELDRLVAQLTTSSARRERIFLEQRIAEVQKDLEAAEKEFSQFASKNVAIDIKEQGKAMVEGAAMLQGQLIAAQSELEGLKQIYTGNNVRVRSLQARVSELELQLNKIGGKNESDSSLEGPPSNSLYPSIRRLPLLGVAYADLYRRTRVEEIVFETLTRECEIAKVEEAKEIPTVRVLDTPNIPDHKSFPPRALITLFGALGSIALGMICVLGRSRWEAVDPADPGKVFAQDVLGAIRKNFATDGSNGSGPNGLRARVFSRFHRRSKEKVQTS